MHKSALYDNRPSNYGTGCRGTTWLLFSLISCLLFSSFGKSNAQEAPEAVQRDGYIVDVELPLVGDRDERVRQQILRIADAANDAEQRPVVVMRFRASPITNVGEPLNGGMGTRGSQFERCLALARFMTSPDASRVRLIAYLPQTVEGHAVLPVLACEDILAAPEAELGRAAIDEPLDATVSGAYRDVVSRRATMPEAIVLAMLDPQVEVYSVDLADGSTSIVGREAARAMREAGQVLSEETLWEGGRLAAFNGQQMRVRRWIGQTVNDETELASALGLGTSLRTPRQLPRQWKAVAVTIAGKLGKSRVNQLIRAVTDATNNDDVNLIVLYMQPATCSFVDAARLASTIAGLGEEGREVYTLSIVTEPIAGAAGLIAVGCDEAVVLSGASLGPDMEQTNSLGNAPMQRVLDDLAAQTGRPLALMAVLADPAMEANEFTHQGTGKRAIFTDWSMDQQADANIWQIKAKVAGGGPLENDIALRYRLIDSVDDSASIALARLGLDRMPAELAMPWLDASIQMVLANAWIPRLLLTIGFFALMAELGNPGIGAGGFLAAVCFLGFFWIEGLNGNVELLEILLFVAGLVALALEIFVVPGFGVFGIGGLLMVFTSVVLASQTFVWPTTSAQLNEVAVNLFWVACLAFGGMVGLLFMHKHLERLPMLRWLSLQPGGTDDLDEIDIRESVAHREHLLGQDGLTTTRLNPSGKAQFGHEIVAVVGTGTLIDEGTPVRVVEVRGNLVLVEALE
ncbi:MAG: NfeD family protein [Pirellulaceae bacterium]